jgi:hypothetical protein
VTAIAGNRPAFRQVVVWLENAVGFHAISPAISGAIFARAKIAPKPRVTIFRLLFRRIYSTFIA